MSNDSGDIRNYMEDCVENMLTLLLANRDFSANTCTCDLCLLDIKAIALNHLPPKYVATRKGALYQKANALQHQFEVDIITAITNAAVIVGNNPRHV